MGFSRSAFAGRAALVLLATAMGCAKGGNRAGDEAAIRAIDSDWVKAAAAKNAEQFASFYADDAALMVPAAPLITGKAAIQKAVAGLFATPGFSLTFAPNTVDVSGDDAYEIGDYSETTNDAKGALQTDKGKYIVVWRRQADGKWQVRVDAPTTTQ